MKKLVMLVVLCVCFVSIGNAQGICDYNSKDIKVLDGRAVLKSSNQPINGVMCGFNKSKELKFTAPHYNGLLDGEVKSYSSNGSVIGKATYKNGVLHGYVHGCLEYYKVEGSYDRYTLEESYNSLDKCITLYERGNAVSGSCSNYGAEEKFNQVQLINLNNGAKVACFYNGKGRFTQKPSFVYTDEYNGSVFY